jgi:hypothetical protein
MPVPYQRSFEHLSTLYSSTHPSINEIVEAEDPVMRSSRHPPSVLMKIEMTQWKMTFGVLGCNWNF